MAGVATAPAAVFTQRHAIRRVALALVGLVVAPLAVLAFEGDRDAYISTGHTWTPVLRVASKTNWGRKTTRPRRVENSV